MSENCFHNNALKRDGTSQQQRTLNTLLPSYVAVDERNMKDLMSFVQLFTEEIKYYNEKNESWDLVNSKHFDWADFFKITNEDWASFSLEDYLEKLKIDQFARPHEALFFGFLYMFRVVQDDINNITGRHLDFYYKEVLQLKEKSAEPDKVSIIFELAKHVESNLLKAGTAVKAGKDNTGEDVVYKLNEDTVINKAQVVEIKAQFANIFNQWVDETDYVKSDHKIYSSPIANSADGLGAEIETEEKDWRVFGRPSFVLDKDKSFSKKNADRLEGQIGFAIASPLLFLAEGKRKIELVLSVDLPLRKPGKAYFLKDQQFLKDKDYLKEEIFIKDQLSLFLSGEEEWIKASIVEDVDATLFYHNSAGSDKLAKLGKKLLQKQRKLLKQEVVKQEGWKIKIIAYVNVEQPSIVAYNNELFQEHINTKWPVVKVVLNTEFPDQDSLYKTLRNVALDNVELSVEIVEELEIPGIQNIIAQNDLGNLDPTKPMQIFGSQPHLGSKFYIGSKEIFQKKLDSLSLKFQWVDLPQNTSFGTYYRHYHVDGPADDRDNTKFRTKIEVLSKKEWQSIDTDQQLFTTSDGADIPATEDNLPDSETKSKISNADEPLKAIDRNVEIEDFEEFSSKLPKGFMRLSLMGMDFGHKEFQNAYAYHAINLANETNGVGPTIMALSYKMTAEPDLIKLEDSNVPVLSGADNIASIATNTNEWTFPNTPYVPTIESLSLFYKSSVSFNLNSTSTETENSDIVEQFFHLEPFGNYEVAKEKSRNTVFPKMNDEGSLYIGIENLNPPQSLALLIQVAEGSANPEKEKQEVKWSYLSKENWLDFDQYTLLSDSTNGLLTSGIVKFDIPRTITTGNSRLSPNLYWLKASIQKDSDAISDIIDIRSQAISASFIDAGNDPKFLENALSAGTITKLLNADAAIKKLEQPYASSDGKPPEKEKAFYTRVSERLRHKSRAITIWDYEHLILEKLPKVYKVKCINHTRFDGTIKNYSETSPGHVSLVIIANVQNKNAVDPLRPRASLDQLSQIASFIETIKPPCAMLHVKNPIYEEIKVDFQVKFQHGVDVGYHISKLQGEIKYFLSPWASDCSLDIVFGGRIHKSVILNFVEERSYVDYVTCFKMYHIVKEDPDNNPNKDVDEAIALTSVSIIGSADGHTINEITTDQCQCDDNVIQSTEELSVIDNC